MKRPPFIVFEGIEGSGKSTQIRLVSDWLTDRETTHVLTREPGGTPVGERIRETVLHGVDLTIPPRAELLLITAARAAFVDQVVEPALEKGAVVLSDRFSWSTLAYQGYGRQLPLDQVRAVDRVATGGLEPDLYLVLDVTVEHGLGRQGRAGKVADRFEGAGPAFLERVRNGYVELVQGASQAVLVDGVGSVEEVQARVHHALASRFPETFSGDVG